MALTTFSTLKVYNNTRDSQWGFRTLETTMGADFMKFLVISPTPHDAWRRSSSSSVLTKNISASSTCFPVLLTNTTYPLIKNKTVFASHTGVFAGYVVSEHGFCPNHALTQVIREFPQSSNVTDLRSFFGLCQQVGNFSPMIAAASCHLPRSSKKPSLGIGPQITKPHLSLQEQNWQ